MLQVPVVAMRCVERVYPGPPPVRALAPTDLAVHRGEYVAVVGPSGSGKSTLLNLLGLLDRPVRGTYEFRGRDTAAMRDYERAAVRARHIGVVFQALRLLPLRTALENVMLAQLYSGTPRHTHRPRAAEALEQVGIGHRAHALASTLSEGERRRVAIARALVNRPSLLLCDEPTGNLDRATAATVLDLLDRLPGADTALMVVTHDPAAAARARRTITIRAGSLEPGPPPAALEPA
jgi:putative ABC transport system ATP-binding protein